MTKKLYDFDLKYGDCVAGCDEAGRGPIAGPVVVAACQMPMDFIIEGINDSKQISPIKREALYNKIIKCADYSIAVIDEEVIDKINILQATKRGMCQCISALKNAGIVLVDAVKLDLSIKTVSIIKGDTLSYNIAAASILAKVYRDKLMIKMDKLYPEYGFAAHKGYGTKFHIEMLKKYGPCKIHRATFIKNFVGENYEEEQ